jgi:hypothetical protein
LGPWAGADRAHRGTASFAAPPVATTSAVTMTVNPAIAFTRGATELAPQQVRAMRGSRRNVTK